MKKVLREFYFGYDLENVEKVMEYVKEKFKGEDYKMWFGYGDDIMNGLEVFNEGMLVDEKLLSLISVCEGEGNFMEEE